MVRERLSPFERARRMEILTRVKFFVSFSPSYLLEEQRNLVLI